MTDTIKKILTESQRNGSLCAMFIDVQGTTLNFGSRSGSYTDAFKTCETLRVGLARARIERIWIALADLDEHKKTTVEKLRKELKPSEDFQIVNPSPQAVAFNKYCQDALNNPYLCDYLDQEQYYTFILAGFFTNACLGRTAVSILNRHLDCTIIVPRDATDMEGTYDSDLRFISSNFSGMVDNIDNIHVTTTQEIVTCFSSNPATPD